MKLKFILRALKAKYVLRTGQPYNLSWFKKPAFFDTLLKDCPISVMDVGARGGSNEELSPLLKHIDFIGFDADREEAERMNANGNTSYRSFKVLPFFVGGSSGTVKFNIYRKKGDSSQLSPNPSFKKYFHPLFEIESVVDVNATTLENYISLNPMQIDFLKIDTQGTELQILRGAKSVLKEALFVETEVEFHEMYVGQALFHDVAAFLYKHDFELFYLNRVFLSRNAYKAPSRGQMIFGDALFVKKKSVVLGQEWKQQLKYCALLINYGHIDLAHEVFVESELLRKNAQELGEFFESENLDSLRLASKINRLIIRFFDKILFLVLLIKRTNALDVDCDRSWPTR